MPRMVARQKGDWREQATPALYQHNRIFDDNDEPAGFLPFSRTSARLEGLPHYA